MSHLLRLTPLALLLLLAACGDDNGPGAVDGGDTGAVDDATTPLDGGADDTDADDTDADAGVDGSGGDSGCDALGCVCERDGDCASGYCIDTADGGRICSELCGERCDDGYVCRLLENQSGDAVRLCVPDVDTYCRACDTAADCGSLQHRCAELDDGSRACATPCEGDDDCADDASCTLSDDGQGGSARYCLPDTGVCSGCIDADEDGFGVGPDCLGPDHDDLDPTAFPGAPERCDGVDNDGDGDEDEGFDLSTDDDNCGACGVICAVDGGSASCVDSACVIDACPDGRGDCDDTYDTGCEVDLTDPSRCGTCEDVGGTVGAACGTCGDGALACGDDGALVCEGDPGDDRLNACGGCATLAQAIGTPCGTCGSGTWACDGLDGVVCDGDLGDAAENACGGCDVLDGAPTDACGPCGLDALVCAGPNALTCNGSTAANACGGCTTLTPKPGDACGSCSLDSYVCDGTDAVVCSGDTESNACGGCAPLPNPVGASCGPCGRDAYVCDGANNTVCALGANCPPTPPVVGIQPSVASPLDRLVCVEETDATDPNGDDVTLAFEWQVDGGDAGVGNSPSVAPGVADTGEVWTCRARGNDGEEAGPWSARASVTIRDACDDGRTSGNESDVDCGGDTLTVGDYETTCPRCGDGDACREDLDCAGGLYCDDTERCTPQVCVPSETVCTPGGDVAVCDARGTDATLLEVCSALGCSDGACEVGCGDGDIGPGEDCDDGIDNSDTEPDACRWDCTEARCGDGVVDTGEDCDGGPSCSASCTSISLGESLPYRETFDSQDGLGAFDSNAVNTAGVNWDVDTSGASIVSGDACGVQGERFIFNDVDGACTWISPIVDISGATSVSVSIFARETGDLEGSDHFEVRRIVDGGAAVLTPNWAGLGSDNATLIGDRPNDSDWETQTIYLTGISGSTLQLLITGENSGSNEVMSFDNVVVSAE